ncbi:MAG: Zn-dependent exopeptidase M28 [Firmicutes bacterium]|nr:Zn-dependent exopeptidase M28 [Bacillota bacterium]
MDQKQLKQIFLDTDFVHKSGTAEELKVAEYLKAQCEALGVPARIEPFPVAMGDIEEAHVYADGIEIPCKGFACCGSGEIEAELYYMPAMDPVSKAGVKDKIVLLDQQGIGYFDDQDLVKIGAKGILFRYNDTNFPNHDIDERDLRPHVVGEAEKLLSAMLHVADAVKLVENGAKKAKIVIRQNEYQGESRNVIAEIPGRRAEWITMTAHYDTTALSHGAYDNMSGCAGLLGVMDALKDAALNYGLRFVFCGSEERGLLGSKAYVRDHEAELESIALNVNLDMIGCTMGKFIACVSAEEALASYLRYLGAELNFPVASRTGVYSSDSTPFADKGVPAVSLARIASGLVAPIHVRYDTMEVMSMAQMEKDVAFIAEFTRRMAVSAACPVSRTIPESVRKELDEYLFKKRKEH